MYQTPRVRSRGSSLGPELEHARVVSMLTVRASGMARIGAPARRGQFYVRIADA
jgi:hypothetical protein